MSTGPPKTLTYIEVTSIEVTLNAVPSDRDRRHSHDRGSDRRAAGLRDGHVGPQHPQPPDARPAPAARGPRRGAPPRAGDYGRRHGERLQLIQQMQADGLKLTAIERLLGGDDDW